MKVFTRKHQKSLVVVLAALMIALIGSNPQLSRGTPKPSLTDRTPLTVFGSTPESAAVIEPRFPERLKIPKIKVDAAIELLGLTPTGDMDNPKDPSNVGWYQNGPQPGDRGNAVLAGHRSWMKNGQVAVFDNLEKLRPGDIVEVVGGNGKTYSFVVTRSQLYDPEAVTTEVFSSTSGSHLNLIASAGTWNEKTKAATKRLVVFTDLTN